MPSYHQAKINSWCGLVYGYAPNNDHETCSIQTINQLISIFLLMTVSCNTGSLSITVLSI
jgi:hypothetical protein